MNINEYSKALLAWSEIDDGSADDVLRRIVLTGNGLLYAAKTNGDLYQWYEGVWNQVGIGNQTEGTIVPCVTK